ncbi:MAG: adenylyl-sulfate kinase [Planctomycetota bacterium]|nr:adenylyl-sulfate kinase [Planctomycetota bacterium]
MGQIGCVVWFTGLSGSGKSTIANRLDGMLQTQGRPSFLLDGDNIRHGLCAGPSMLEPQYGASFAQRFGLGFSPQDREENIRRVGAVTCLMASAGLICLTAFVSPYRKDRDRVRSMIEEQAGLRFFEVFVDTPLAICEQRDPKGLYRQAREGKIPFFTGITDPYEPPPSPDLVIEAGTGTPEIHAQSVLEHLALERIFRDLPRNSSANSSANTSANTSGEGL